MVVRAWVFCTLLAVTLQYFFFYFSVLFSILFGRLTSAVVEPPFNLFCLLSFLSVAVILRYASCLHHHDVNVECQIVAVAYRWRTLHRRLL